MWLLSLLIIDEVIIILIYFSLFGVHLSKGLSLCSFCVVRNNHLLCPAGDTAASGLESSDCYVPPLNTHP